VVLKRKRDAGLGERADSEILGFGAIAAQLVDGYVPEVLVVMFKEEGSMRKHDE
jgi:hypothetical protein